LEDGSLTSSEIAYKVGFGSPSYFIRSFHDYFGYPPGEYLKHAPEEPEKVEMKVLSNENFTEKEKSKLFYKISTVVNKKILVVLVVIAVIVTGILVVLNIYGKRELSIAVLPFENLVGQNENEYLAYGVQAELIGELSKLKELRVISQKSTQAYKDTIMSLKNIARKLNVKLVMTAGLIIKGDSLEIILNLVDVFPNESNILTNKYSTDIQDIKRFNSLAVSDIAQKLHLNFTDDLRRQINYPRKVNLESLKAYYSGMYYLGKDNPESFETGIRYLLEAIDRDPADPFAYAAVALGYAIKGHHSNTSEEDFTKARYYSDIALNLDSTIDEAYTARAMLYLYQGWEWDKAKEAFNEALERNPNNDIAHANFAWYYVVRGDLKNAIYHAEKAVIINPLFIERNAWLACIYYNAKEYAKAEIYAKKVLAERDNSVYGNIVMGWINLLRKNYPEAIKCTEKLRNWDYYSLYRAYTYYKSGDKEKALSYRNAMEEKAKTKYVWEWHRGLMAAIFGYKEEAFKYFNIAIDKKQYQMMYLNWYPFTESLRNDPRYNELLIRMNLPPYFPGP
jgi:TolB-like protein/Tfp pilus assembly protein PilF